MIIPDHIGVIMDGNGRWAEKRKLAKSFGHKIGARTLKDLCKKVDELGVKYVTVYAFSKENWKRSNDEVEFLMKLLQEFVKEQIRDKHKDNAQIVFLGERDGIPKEIVASMAQLEDETKEMTGLKVYIAVNYSGRDEIVRATKNIVKDVLDNKLKMDDIDETLFSSYLYSKDTPDPDLIIRTSGEFRISNFLLWQSAYSEFYFTKTLWPDFDEKEIMKALTEYNARERRFGGR